MRATAENGLIEHPGHDRSITRTRCSPFEELTEYASQEKIQRQEIETLAQEEGQQVLGQEAEPQVVVARGQIRPDKRNEIDRRGLMSAAGLFLLRLRPSGLPRARCYALTKLLLHVRVAEVQIAETLLGRFYRPRYLPLS